MAAEQKPKRTVLREVPSTFDFKKVATYALPVLVVVGLLTVLFKSPAHAHHAGAGLVGVLILGLGYAGWSHTETLSPDDGIRNGVRAATISVVLACLAAAGFTFFPPSAQHRLRLSRVGDHAEVEVAGAATAVVLTTEGNFKPDVGTSVRAVYAFRVSHDNHEEDIEGRFTRDTPDVPAGSPPTTGGATEIRSNRHVLQTLRGSGMYTITLDHIPESVNPPVLVAVSTEPFTQWMLGILFVLLIGLSVVVDVALARRGSEPAFAASMMVPLVAVFYLHGHFTRASLTNSLVSAGLVGLLGGGLGGELLARLGRSVGGR